MNGIMTGYVVEPPLKKNENQDHHFMCMLEDRTCSKTADFNNVMIGMIQGPEDV